MHRVFFAFVGRLVFDGFVLFVGRIFFMRRCVVRRVAGLAALFARLQRARLRIERRCVFGHHWLLADLLRLFRQRGGHDLLFEHLDRRLVGLERFWVRARL